MPEPRSEQPQRSMREMIHDHLYSQIGKEYIELGPDTQEDILSSALDGIASAPADKKEYLATYAAEVIIRVISGDTIVLNLENTHIPKEKIEDLYTLREIVTAVVKNFLATPSANMTPSIEESVEKSGQVTARGKLEAFLRDNPNIRLP